MEVVPRKRRPYSTLEKLEMKKTLVALAAVSAVSAFAQTNFQPSGAVPNPAFKGFVVTGGFDASYANLKYKGGNSVSAITYNSTSTSQITMIGIEDLGGGLKADFNYESDINPTTMYNTGVAGLNGTARSATAGAANFSGAQAASTWGNGQVKVGIQTSMGYLGLSNMACSLMKPTTLTSFRKRSRSSLTRKISTMAGRAHSPF